jgi:hypothetical protein
MLELPARLAERARRRHGASGRSWAEHLPEMVAAAQRDWSLAPQAVLSSGQELSVLIAVTTADGQCAVLKAPTRTPDRGTRPPPWPSGPARRCGPAARGLLLTVPRC